MKQRFPLFRSALCALASLAALGSGCAYVNVPPGHVAVDWTTDGMSDKIYSPGSWGIGVYDQPTIFDARSQEREERLNVLTANGERIILDTSIRYHIIPNEALALIQSLGTHYYSILIGPTLRSQARRVIGRYLPEELYSTKREAIEREIRTGVEQGIQGRHLILEAVLIRDVTLPEEIQQAINDKLQAEQNTLKQKYLIETAKLVADRQKIEAEGEAQQARIRAQGQADAKKIEGQGVAAYEKEVAKNLTPEVLKFQEIENLNHLARSSNAKILMFGDSKTASPLIDLKNQ